MRVVGLRLRTYGEGGVEIGSGDGIEKKWECLGEIMTKGGKS